MDDFTDRPNDLLSFIVGGEKGGLLPRDWYPQKLTPYADNVHETEAERKVDKEKHLLRVVVPCGHGSVA